MPRVKYVGAHRPGVDVVFQDGRQVAVEYDQELEVSAAERDQLLTQGDEWTEVKGKTAKTTVADGEKE